MKCESFVLKGFLLLFFPLWHFFPLAFNVKTRIGLTAFPVFLPDFLLQSLFRKVYIACKLLGLIAHQILQACRSYRTANLY